MRMYTMYTMRMYTMYTMRMYTMYTMRMYTMCTMRMYTMYTMRMYTMCTMRMYTICRRDSPDSPFWFVWCGAPSHQDVCHKNLLSSDGGVFYRWWWGFERWRKVDSE